MLWVIAAVLATGITAFTLGALSGYAIGHYKALPDEYKE